MSELAILGGSPIRTKPFPDYITIGAEEAEAVASVVKSTVLSQYLGKWHKDFYGGPRVQALEREWECHFGVEHAITVNSATSGLYAAIGAIGVGPGDEVIVSPYTMTASASCVLVYNAIPVFADIDEEIFSISAESIKNAITERTKAIVLVDIFGHPGDFDEIMEMAKEHNLVVIEDAAQAPGATLHGRSAGTLADIGVYSLNYHKTIHTGEGGVVVTDNSAFAERIQLIRNHAEVVVQDKGVDNIVNMLGFNYRMTEIEAAIGSEQLKKLEKLTAARIACANYLTSHLKQHSALTTPVVRNGVVHGYYVYPIKYNSDLTGVSRAKFAAALRAEGVQVGEGYVEPIYLLPLYQQQVVYGYSGCPFNCPHYTGTINYEKGICPISERMHERELLTLNYCNANMTTDDLSDIVAAFEKVFDNINKLQ